MQMAVIEFARNVLKIKNASSTEFDKNIYPIVSLLTEWNSQIGYQKRDTSSDLGGTMRLGSYECHLKKNSKIANIYNKKVYINFTIKVRKWRNDENFINSRF